MPISQNLAVPSAGTAQTTKLDTFSLFFFIIDIKLLFQHKTVIRALQMQRGN